jgi:hypothetical protein
LGLSTAPRGWEATIPGNYRAQSLINKDLDKCDYFVGVPWNHWGSKPDDGDSKYTSGFEEEFERATGRFDAGSMIDIVLFFKDIPEEQLKDPGPSVSRVIEFKQKCVQLRKPLFQTFSTIAEFEPIFRLAMEKIGWLECEKLGTLATGRANISEPDTPNAERSAAEFGTQTSLLEVPAIEFVSQLLNRQADWGATDAYEVARFRLISAGTSRAGNDEPFLGTHDANLLFKVREKFSFSDQEIYTLIDTGVAGFQHQNVPLWHWVAKEPGHNISFHRIQMLAVAGGSSKSRALRILQCTGQDIPVLGYSREDTLRMWLIGDKEQQDISAVLELIKTNGGDKDRILLQKIISDAESKHFNEIVTTIIHLESKNNPLIGLSSLISNNLESVSDSLLDLIFERSDSIPTEKLRQCLALRSNKLRRRGAHLLNVRKAMTTEEAIQLFSDNDPAVRLEGAECLFHLGKPKTDEELKSALVLTETTGWWGLNLAARRNNDDSYYQEYVRKVLSTKTATELKDSVISSNVFANQELRALYSRFTKRYLNEIELNLTDGFEKYFNEKLGELSKTQGSDTKLMSDTKELGNFIRQKLTSITLNALCAWAGRSSLDLVRKTIDEYEVQFSEEILGFLGRFGDWSDANRIISFYRRLGNTLSLLGDVSRDKKIRIASSLHAVGRGRLADLLDLPIDPALRPSVLCAFTKSEVVRLSDEVLIGELNSDYEDTRKVIALLIARDCPAKRVKAIIEKYTGGERYFYNALHWLDLGASMPRNCVRKVTHFELAKLNQ